MTQGVQHLYECQCKGCPNGFRSTYYGAPPEVWANKGQSLPRACHDCRKWRKSQQEEKSRCSSCNRIIRIPRNFKISYYMKTGPWVPTEQCQRCERGQKPSKSVTKQQNLPGTLRRLRPAQALSDVPYDQLSDYRKDHYCKHIIGHPLSEVGQPRGDPAKGEVVTSTKLVGANATSLEMYEAGCRVAFLTGNDVYQYKSGSGIVKVRVVGMELDHVEVTVFRRKPNTDKYEFLTSYDEIRLAKARLKVDKVWL